MTLSIQNNNNRSSICFIKLENQTNKNLKLKNFSSLYFYGKLNKQMSKKENLYQYLFVQQILSKTSSDFKESRLTSLESRTRHNFQKTSLILENLKLVNPDFAFSPLGTKKSNIGETFSNKSELANKTKPNGGIKLFLQDKIFITYKKSFLCYWLLPFFGLVNCFPTFLQSSVKFPFVNNEILLGTESAQRLDSSLYFVKADRINNSFFKVKTDTAQKIDNLEDFLPVRDLQKAYGTNFDIEHMSKLGGLGKKEKETFKNFFGDQTQIFLKKSISKKLLPSYKVLKKNYQKSSQSLLLTILNLNLARPDVKLTDFSFAMLNRNIKLRSQFKWYWFDLFLNHKISSNVVFSKLELIPSVVSNSPDLASPAAFYFFPNKISSPVNLIGSKTILQNNKPSFLFDHSFQSNGVNPPHPLSTEIKKLIEEKNQAGQKLEASNFLFLDGILKAKLSINKINEGNKNLLEFFRQFNFIKEQPTLYKVQAETRAARSLATKKTEQLKNRTKYLMTPAKVHFYKISSETQIKFGQTVESRDINIIPDNYLIGIFKTKKEENGSKLKSVDSYTNGNQVSLAKPEASKGIKIKVNQTEKKIYQASKLNLAFENALGNKTTENALGNKTTLRSFLLKQKRAASKIKKMTPYKSLKKAYFLMDNLKITSSMDSLSTSIHTAFTGKEKANSQTYSWKKENQIENQVLQKTILLILKNKNSYPNLYKAQADKINKGDQESASMKAFTNMNNSDLFLIKREENENLYSSIFEGLKYALGEQIIKNRAYNLYSNSYKIKENLRPKKITLGPWQSNYEQEARISSATIKSKKLLTLSSDSFALAASRKAPLETFLKNKISVQNLLFKNLDSKQSLKLKESPSVIFSAKNELSKIDQQRIDFLLQKELLLSKNTKNTGGAVKEEPFKISVLTSRDPIRGGTVFLNTNFVSEKELKSSASKIERNHTELKFDNKKAGLSLVSFLPRTQVNSSDFSFWFSSFARKARNNNVIDLENKLNYQVNNKNSQIESTKKKVILHDLKTNQLAENLITNSGGTEFLSKYLGVMTTNIKKMLSPYKLRLTYLSEVNISESKLDCARRATNNKMSNYLKNKIKLKVDKITKGDLASLKNDEKIFLSFLSKSKKSSIFYGTGNHKSSLFLLKGSSQKSVWLKKLKRNQKLNLSRNLYKVKADGSFFDSNLSDVFTNQSKKQTSLINRTGNFEKYSPSMLLKNKLFINKEIDYIKSYNFALNLNTKTNKKTSNFEDSFSQIKFEQEPVLIKDRLKKQHKKIKRRLKKMKKETRRHKKRKIFYPRPTWIIFSMYKNFIKSRASADSNSKKFKSQIISISDFTKVKARDTNQKAASSSSLISLTRKKVDNYSVKISNRFEKKIDLMNGSAVNKAKNSNKTVYSFWLSKNRNKFYSPEPVFLANKTKNSKEFYTISRTVLSDLRRILLKSTWSRSYLNPYLEKVKSIYKEMETSSKKMSIYMNLRSLILYVYGSLNEPFFSIMNLDSFKATYTQAFPMYLNVKKSLFEGQNNLPLSETKSESAFSFKKNRIENSGGAAFLNKENQKRQYSINLLEYNRIVYQRIQRIILNIRDNLNLNGQIKNRSKKLVRSVRAFIKRDYAKRDDMTTNQKTELWSKIIKNNFFKFGLALGYNGYDHSVPYPNSIQLFSRNNFYWALNKSEMLTNANFYTSSTKKLWETYKIREISKSNKTKKLIFNILRKYNNFAQPIYSLNNTLVNILERSNRNIKFITDLSRFDDSFATSKYFNSLEGNQNANFITDTEQDNKKFEAENQEPLTLKAKIYTVKSQGKLIQIENKLKLLGVYSQKIQDNYKKAYFRSLTEQVLKTRSNSLGHFTKSPNLFELSSPYSKYFGNYFYAQKTYTAADSYWWSFLKDRSTFNNFNTKPVYAAPTLNVNFDNPLFSTIVVKKDTTFLSPVTLSSFLFHFCALVSFISLGGVRTLIKFYYILISKISKMSYLAENIVRLLPKNLFLGKKVLAKKAFFANDFSLGFFKPNVDLENKNDIFAAPLSIENEITYKNNIAVKNMKRVPHSFFKYLMARKTKANLSLKGNYVVLDSNFSSIFSNGSALLFKIKNSRFLVSILFKIKNSRFLVSIPALQVKQTSLILKDSLELLLFTTQETKKILKSTNSFSPLKGQTKEISNELKSSQGGPLIIKNELETKNPYLNKTGLIKVAGFTRRLSKVLSLAHKLSFYSYVLLLKSIDVLAVPASFIYKFFEKPEEYVVENLAYSFLVEWSADLISTIPDTVDTNLSIYFSKINTRGVSPLIFINMDLGFQAKLALFNLKMPLSFADFPFLFSGFAGNSFLKRLLNSSLLLFIQQLCEPDLDSINRQKKGIIFWDIWGEYLKKVALLERINIYELTSDKEEQVKLLSKYEETIGATFTRPKKASDISSAYSWSGQLAQKAGWGAKTGIFLEKGFNNTLAKYSLYPLNSVQNLNKKNLGTPIFNKTYNSITYQSVKNQEFINFSSPLSQALNSKIGRNLSIGNNAAAPQKSDSGSKKGNADPNYYGWSVSQFLSYQGKDTDLFIDLHPPKSFSTSAAFLQLRLFSVQQPIGSIVCQIFSGIFYKQISKNILVVGSSGLEKSLLIQAIAGETELKIITDNAHRYAMVYRGVAVGIKLLRDVFEALSLYTPCIFLMEDIHAIGERRPFLIDHDHPTDSNATESTYNKNQSMQALLLKEKSSASREGLYKNNKHLVSHYKKPYKSGKLLATNHFSFTFLFGDIFNKIRNNEIRQSGQALPIQVIKKERAERLETKYKNIKQSPSFSKVSKLNQSGNQYTFMRPQEQFNSSTYSSSLLIKSSKDELLAPPASSPFNVLILKEEAKLKHKNLVKEMPWFGLPGEQFSLVSKYNYSIRVKVALLADLVLSNLSVKLEMITDLLVIIDSVKGNRGFVVFATTHVPYILDPALRRPGRFDETISLPIIPALYSRWTNYRYNVQYLTTSLFNKYSIPFNSTFNKGTTLDLSLAPLITSQTISMSPLDKLINLIYIKASKINETDLINSDKGQAFKLLTKLKLNHNPSDSWTLNSLSINTKNYYSADFALKPKTTVEPQTNSTTALKQINSSFFQRLLSLEYFKNRFSFVSSNLFNSNALNKLRAFNSDKITNKHKLQKNNKSVHLDSKMQNRRLRANSLNLGSQTSYSNKISNKQSLYMKSTRYAYACKSLLSLLIFSYYKNNSSYSNLDLQQADTQKVSLNFPSILRQLGNFALEDYSVYLSLFGYPVMLKIILMSVIGGKLGESFALSSNLKRNQQDFLKNKSTLGINNSFLFNFDRSSLDKLASSLVFSYAEKRQFSTFNKNLLSTKLLSFNNKYSLMEAPSPPISNILLPAKRYENYQRTLNNQIATLTNQNNFNASVSEKIRLHQQQRLLKRLYKYPIKEFFRSERVERTNTKSNFSNFNAARVILNPLEKTNLASINKLSSVNWCYKNILYNRHKTYLTNQWWNGQLGEHNAETTFLSDIDWRYTFVQSIGDINIDFPDSEQLYNPRNRRWILTNGDWNYWFNIQGELKEIYSHYVYECFTKAYNYLSQNREIIDFYAEFLHQSPLISDLKERELLNLYKRFFYNC